MTSRDLTRKEPEKIEKPIDLGEKIYVGNLLGDTFCLDKLSIQELHNNDNDLFLFSVVNRFIWIKDAEKKDYRLILESQRVLIKRVSIFSIEWDYGIVDMFGNVVVDTHRTYPLSSCDEIYIVSPEEYSINTSRWYKENNPDLAYLINPNTHNYL